MYIVPVFFKRHEEGHVMVHGLYDETKTLEIGYLDKRGHILLLQMYTYIYQPLPTLQLLK